MFAPLSRSPRPEDISLENFFETASFNDLACLAFKVTTAFLSVYIASLSIPLEYLMILASSFAALRGLSYWPQDGNIESFHARFRSINLSTGMCYTFLAMICASPLLTTGWASVACGITALGIALFMYNNYQTTGTWLLCYPRQNP